MLLRETTRDEDGTWLIKSTESRCQDARVRLVEALRSASTLTALAFDARLSAEERMVSALAAWNAVSRILGRRD